MLMQRFRSLWAVLLGLFRFVGLFSFVGFLGFGSFSSSALAAEMHRTEQIEVELVAAAQHLPDLFHHLGQVGTGGAEMPLREGDIGLHGRVLAQRFAGMARGLGGGQGDERIEYGPCDAERDAGKRHPVERGQRDPVEGTGLPQVGAVIAQETVRFRHEQVFDGVVVAAWPLESHGIPDRIDDRGLGGKQEGADVRPAVLVHPRGPVGTGLRGVGADPGDQPAANALMPAVA